MVLTALPDGAAEDGLARGAEAWMIIGNDIGDTAHATGNQGLQEGAPVHFGLGERTGNTEHPAALVGADADHREHGGVAHHATLSDFLIARVGGAGSGSRPAAGCARHPAPHPRAWRRG